jgi:hypothetical protein
VTIKGCTYPSKLRKSLINDLGAKTLEEAIDIINGSQYATARERNTDLLIRYLRGETFREVGAAHGVSVSRASEIINRAIRMIRLERRQADPETEILSNLPYLAWNSLRNEIIKCYGCPLTDDELRAWVLENGAMALLDIPHIGPKTQKKICDAFGFFHRSQENSA